MIKITNGIDVFEVTNGAYEGIYKYQGFKPIKKVEAVAEEVAAPTLSEDDAFIESLLEKPISQWSKNEVKKFAGLKEIDLTGTKNVNEAKEIIKNFIDQTEAEEIEEAEAEE